MKPAASSARIARTLARLERLYLLRKRAGQSCDWLFPRCRRISAFYLAALDTERHA